MAIQLQIVQKPFPFKLQYLRDELRKVVQSPEFREMVASGRYYPDFTLIDAICAVEEAMSSYEQYKQQQEDELEALNPF